MATIINYSIKAEDLKGTVNEKGYINLTLEVKDEATEWGSNVIGYKSQTADQRKAKELKTFIGGGKVVWSNSEGVLIPAKK